MEKYPSSDDHNHMWPRLELDLSSRDADVYAVIFMAAGQLEGEQLEHYEREMKEAMRPGSGKRYDDILAIVNSYMDLVDTSGTFEAYAPWSPEG